MFQVFLRKSERLIRGVINNGGMGVGWMGVGGLGGWGKEMSEMFSKKISRGDGYLGPQNKPRHVLALCMGCRMKML